MSRPKGFKVSEETKKKNSEAHKGIPLSKEHCQKISEGKKGKPCSEETKQKLRDNAKINPDHGMKNKIHSIKARQKISNTLKGHSYSKGRKISKEGRLNMSKAQKGKKLSKEHKHKLRLVRLKRMEEDGYAIYPNYNKNACEFFKQFDEENNTSGRFAVYGGGEFHIKDLGRFPDYINFDLKLIMEWDEEYHFTKKQIKEDLYRQKEIQKIFPNFEFRRIREKELATRQFLLT